MPDGEGAETFVQVAPAGGGYDIRNVQVTLLQSDGSLVTTMQQVVSIADEDGRVLSFATMEQLLARILDTLEHMRSHMEMNV